MCPANLLPAATSGPECAEFLYQAIRRDVEPPSDQKRRDLNILKPEGGQVESFGKKLLQRNRTARNVQIRALLERQVVRQQTRILRCLGELGDHLWGSGSRCLLLGEHVCDDLKEKPIH